MIFLEFIMGKKISEEVHWVKVSDHWTRYSTVEYFRATNLDNAVKNNKTIIIMLPGKFLLNF